MGGGSSQRKVVHATRLFMRQVVFVGHVLGGGVRRPAPGKLAAVQMLQVPETVSALRAFLVLCND